MTQKIQLLRAKLQLPGLQIGLVVRSRLLEELKRANQYKLTVVAAPAGFGKTTLLAQWVKLSNEAIAQTAWLSLDEADNDPVRFWSYFLAACATLLPHLNSQTSLLLQAASEPEDNLSFVATILGSLETALAEVNPTEPGAELVLILDDYHLITNNVIHTQFKYLLEHLPSALHLIIASRTEPALGLGRLRARGQLNELRDSQLRFNLKETAEFLNQTMALALPAEVIARIEVQTEGWVATLQLAAYSLRQQADNSQTSSHFLENFSGANRYILDYLTQEVFEQQRPQVQHFLLQISPLNQFSAALCGVVTSEANSQALL
jgi:LuxR family maltose regulon positive regulatory protein